MVPCSCEAGRGAATRFLEGEIGADSDEISAARAHCDACAAEVAEALRFVSEIEAAMGAAPFPAGGMERVIAAVRAEAAAAPTAAWAEAPALAVAARAGGARVDQPVPIPAGMNPKVFGAPLLPGGTGAGTRRGMNPKVFRGER